MLEIIPATAVKNMRLLPTKRLSPLDQLHEDQNGAPSDKECVFDSDTILDIKHLPKKVIIIGAGVIGCE